MTNASDPPSRTVERAPDNTRAIRVSVAVLSAAFILEAAAWIAIALKGGFADSHPILAGSVGTLLVLAPAAALFAFLFGRAATAMEPFLGRGDGEARLLVARIAIAAFLLAGIAVWTMASPASPNAALAAVGLGLGEAAAWLCLVHFIAAPAKDAVRRAVALILDVAVLSILMVAGDKAAAPWFLLYPWLVFTHGRRGGATWLQASTAASVAGFAAVAAVTPVWRANWPISVGLLLALAILPTYVAAVVRRLTQAQDAAESVAAARGSLFALTGEELRTPLGAMIGLADLMRGPELSGEQTTMLDTIRSSAGAMLGMIDDLLDFSAIESGSPLSRPSGFDLPRLVEDVVALAAPEATRKGLMLGCRIDPLLPDTLIGHPIELRRMLTGLVSAAIRRTEHGEVRLTADPMTDQGTAPLSTVRLRFEIRDTGPGEPESPGDSSGRSLHLPLVRELARLMGGAVDTIGEPGVGSRVVVDIPMARTPQGLPRRLDSAAVGIFGTDQGLGRIFASLPVLDAMGVRFAALGATPVQGQENPAGYHLLVFDGRADPVEALAAAARLGGRATRTAPATLVVANAGLVPHLKEMAPAAVDTLLPWPADEAVLVRTIGRLLGRAEKISGAAAPVSIQPAVAPQPAAVPAAEAAPIAPLAEEQTAPAPSYDPDRKFRVLVAEDNQTNRIVIERILARAGHQVLHAHDGSEALSALEAGGIDAAILDLNMPELSGYHVAKLYRQMEPVGEHLPMIGLTAEATSETDRLCREAGMDAAVIKPVPPEEMLTLLAKLVEASPGQRRAPFPSMVVTPITAHPRFAREAAIIDSTALEALAGLGDDAFFRDVIDAFFADAEQSLDAMTNARADRDYKVFKDHLHALRSSAVNVGASRLCQLIQEANEIPSDEVMSASGTAAVAKLRGELGALRSELTKYTSQRRPAE